MSDLEYRDLAVLVTKTQNGCQDAFAELYTATYQRQYRISYGFMHDPYLAQDVLQEVYILVLKRIHTLKNPKLFISWLNQINIHLCSDWYEKNSRNQQELFLDDSQFTPPRSKMSEDSIADYSDRHELMEQVKSLPGQEQQAILLRYYHEMKLDEIADIMRCSKSTVKRLLTRGYNKLRTTITAAEGGVLHE